MKILANDGLDKIAIEKLNKMNIEIDTNNYEGEKLVEELKQNDVVIIRSATTLDKQILEQVKGTNLKLLIRAGVGLDNIDVEYANANGFEVRNTPKSNINAVAELVVGSMFALARFIPIANMTCKQGKWNKKSYQGIEIQGKTVGIIGMGNVGKLIADKAKVLGMNVIFYDAFVEKYEDLECMDMESLLKCSDFITINTPFIKENFIGAKEINMMKQGSYIINTSRGDNLDERAVATAIENGKLSGAFIDVFKDEPNINEELKNNDKIYLTPHIGGATNEAQANIGLEIVDIVNEFIKK